MLQFYDNFHNSQVCALEGARAAAVAVSLGAEGLGVAALGREPTLNDVLIEGGGV